MKVLSAIISHCGWISLVGFALCMNVHAAQDEQYAEELGSGNYLSSVITQRGHLIEAMLTVVRSKFNDNTQKIEAIKILGLIRAEEAVPILIENITLADSEFIKDLPSLNELYPCVSALISIGNPSTIPLLNKIAEGGSTLEMRLYTYTLTIIETEQFAKLKLKKRLQSTTDKLQQENLRSALGNL